MTRKSVAIRRNASPDQMRTLDGKLRAVSRPRTGSVEAGSFWSPRKLHANDLSFNFGTIRCAGQNNIRLRDLRKSRTKLGVFHPVSPSQLYAGASNDLPFLAG